jgi:acyl-CoA hydrolase
VKPDDEGAVTGFVAVIAVALVLVAGMVLDGGQLVTTGVEARRLAASAARAGAQEIDVDVLRSTGTARLSPIAARRAALDYLAAADTTGTVDVHGGRVTVTVVLEHQMRILPLGTRAISATRAADAVAAIRDPGDLP